MSLKWLVPGVLALALVVARPATAQTNDQKTNAAIRSFLAPTVGGLVGSLGAAAGISVGAAAGGCFGGPGANSTSGCFNGIVAGAAFGYLLGMPAGVTWIHGLFDGRGNFGGAFTGALVATALTGFIGYTLTGTTFPPGPEVLGYIVLFAATLPLTGTMLGYAVSEWMADVVTGQPSWSMAPVLRDGRVEGGMVTFALTRF